jgi:uncharacterized protein YceH (UPF0502 family)
MNITLNAIEARVLGALVEKEITTPEYYPLSLNALVNACNQKNNRDPVMSLDEGAVRQALSTLDDKGLAATSRNRDSRVVKFEHHMQEVFNFRRDETAIMCELLLRGPQTPGELRGRAERMYAFEDLSAVQSTLQRLAQHDPPLVKMLPKQAGMKESRFAHLLSGDVEGWQPEPSPEPSPEPHRQVISHDAERIAQLEVQVNEVQKELLELKRRLDAMEWIVRSPKPMSSEIP